MSHREPYKHVIEFPLRGTTYECIRVYNDGVEAITPNLNWSEMMAWLNYNRNWRPGVALFVNGECQQTGLLTFQHCMDLVRKFQKEKTA